MDRDTFAEACAPLAEIVAKVDPNDPAAAKAYLDAHAPLDGPVVAKLREAAEQGAREGWLCPKEAGGLRFGRVAKDLHGLSIDAVEMVDVDGPDHVHPNGEIDLLWATSGDPRFDKEQNHAQGWAVYEPGSEHVPSVHGGGMLILYFLPGGAIEFR